MAYPSPPSDDPPHTCGVDDAIMESSRNKSNNTQTDKAAKICRNRGAEILGNHLIVEHIVKYLPDVVDIINLRRTCSGVSGDVKHYLVRQAESLDFSNAHSVLDYQIREFLRSLSSLDSMIGLDMRRPVHQWDRLTYLDLSNTGITEHFMINIILQTFKDVDWRQHHQSNARVGTECLPERFIHLNQIRAQGCTSLNVEEVLDVLQKLLFRRLEGYWEQEAVPQVLPPPLHVVRRVESPLGSQVWQGPIPANIEELEKTGLIGYTRLQKLFLGNSARLVIEKDLWQKTAGNKTARICPFQHNVARWLCITGALGIETEIMFCHSYCDSHNAYLWDGWTIDEIPESLIDEYSQMRLHHTIHKQLAAQGMGKFPKLKNEDPMPRMPWEIRIEHVPTSRTFYFPGTGEDHKQQLKLDDLNLGTSLVCTSAIDKAVANFNSYDLSEQRFSLHKMTDKNWAFPENWTHPDPRDATADEGWLAYLFRYCLRERNFQLYKYALPNSPRDNLEILPPYPAIVELSIRMQEVEYVLKRMLRCPLPRRIYPSHGVYALPPDTNWWDVRRVALIEYPRGLCSRCLREVWLCETCNRNPKAFCAECMISMQETTNAKQRMKEPEVREDNGDDGYGGDGN
ncbi:hypothetical protein TWF730_004935 [Orbilia blumenaviensis]|uniref:Uncharacterized protein n=1 Tax=Orbilia blumenaviensis TaxID=1796055 RepID=A0AAV9VJ13_9PEZI